METKIAELVQTFGLGIALSIGLFCLLFFLIKHYVKSIDAERSRWISLAENHIKQNTDAMGSLINETKRLSERNDEAHKYQREEHYEMIKILNKIHGGV